MIGPRLDDDDGPWLPFPGDEWDPPGVRVDVPEVDFDPVEPEVLLGPDGRVIARSWRPVGFYLR